MRIASVHHKERAVVGIVDGEQVFDIAEAARRQGGSALPGSVIDIIASGPALLDRMRDLLESGKSELQDPALWKPLKDCRLLPPLGRPRKNVFCVGRNYKLHIEEGARARGVEPSFPQVPEFFTKPPTAVIGPEDEVRIDPAVSKQMDYEVELGIVIGKGGRDLKGSAVREAVFGYTVVNDVTARDLQKAHGQWFKGKGLDTSCPIGPWIVTADEFGEPGGHRITLSVNGEMRQDSDTGDMLFDCDAIVASLSAGLTLEPGDVIATGTPSGVGLGLNPPIWLKEGDVMEATIEGIGTLRNRVRSV